MSGVGREWGPVILKFVLFSLIFELFFTHNVCFALLFYVHGKHLRSCRDGQLT